MWEAKGSTEPRGLSPCKHCQSSCRAPGIDGSLAPGRRAMPSGACAWLDGASGDPGRVGAGLVGCSWCCNCAPSHSSFLIPHAQAARGIARRPRQRSGAGPRGRRAARETRQRRPAHRHRVLSLIRAVCPDCALCGSSVPRPSAPAQASRPSTGRAACRRP